MTQPHESLPPEQSLTHQVEAYLADQAGPVELDSPVTQQPDQFEALSAQARANVQPIVLDAFAKCGFDLQVVAGTSVEDGYLLFAELLAQNSKAWERYQSHYHNVPLASQAELDKLDAEADQQYAIIRSAHVRLRRAINPYYYGLKLIHVLATPQIIPDSFGTGLAAEIAAKALTEIQDNEHSTPDEKLRLLTAFQEAMGEEKFHEALLRGFKIESSD